MSDWSTILFRLLRSDEVWLSFVNDFCFFIVCMLMSVFWFAGSAQSENGGSTSKRRNTARKYAIAITLWNSYANWKWNSWNIFLNFAVRLVYALRQTHRFKIWNSNKSRIVRRCTKQFSAVSKRVSRSTYTTLKIFHIHSSIQIIILNRASCE